MYKLKVRIYPEGRVLEVDVGGPRIKVGDLLLIVEGEIGAARDYYAVALEGRLLSSEDVVEAGREVVLVPLVTGGCLPTPATSSANSREFL